MERGPGDARRWEMSCVTNENDFSWDSDCQSILGGTYFLLGGYVTSASWLPLAAVVHILLGRKYERLYLRVEISNERERMGDLRCGEDLLPLVTVAQLFPFLIKFVSALIA